MKVISLWSGPRNVSTALMYSFAQRPDTLVIDEPLYAHYLAKVNVDHPGREEVLLAMDADGQRVLESILSKNYHRPIIFLKNMAHHWRNIDHSLLKPMQHLFLIRDPREMLPSLANQLPNPVLRDTGLDIQKKLLEEISLFQDQIPVINARELLTHPESILKKTCDMLNIKYYKEMLSWNEGPRPEDGIWAKYWYKNVHQSNGFEPYTPKNQPFPAHLTDTLNESIPYYNHLYQYALK